MAANRNFVLSRCKIRVLDSLQRVVSVTTQQGIGAELVVKLIIRVLLMSRTKVLQCCTVSVCLCLPPLDWSSPNLPFTCNRSRSRCQDNPCAHLRPRPRHCYHRRRRHPQSPPWSRCYDRLRDRPVTPICNLCSICKFVQSTRFAHFVLSV